MTFAGMTIKARSTASILTIGTVIGLGLAALQTAAQAEIAVKSSKSDKSVVLASLDWQPANTSSAEWVAFKPVSSDRGLSGNRPKNPLNEAFDLFARSEPVQIAGGKNILLQTASIDPNTPWVRGAAPRTIDQSPAASASTAVSLPPLESKPVVAPLNLTAALPVPHLKPAKPLVKVASLAPTELPAPEQQHSVLNAAPVLGEPRRMPEGASAYIDIFRREASLHKVPLWLALGVAWVESKFDPKLRGTHTVVGMMQVMPSTAREMGYKGTTNELFSPETNIVWGMNELAKDYEIAKGDICLTIAKYKGGFHTHSINKGAWNYCSQVKRVTGMTEVADARQ